MAASSSPILLASPRGAIYGVQFATTAPSCHGSLLWLPPFAEEANCARRHIVAAARECQALGYASLLIDPFGTGESDGDFNQATWDIWRHNVIDAARWLREHDAAPLWLVGVRAGALLAADVVSEILPAGMACWQPVSAGRMVLDNFLRMKLAAEWAQSGSANAIDILTRLREELSTGLTVEVAGYELSASLAGALAERTLSWSSQSCARLACIEFRPHIAEPASAQHTPAVARLCDGFRSAGMHLASAVCEAPAFWQMHETPLTPGLGRATLNLVKALSNV